MSYRFSYTFMNAKPKRKRNGWGWIPDRPDFRDREKAFDPPDPLVGAPSEKYNLQSYFPPVEDQGDLGSCTAQAGVGLLEYFENRSFGKFADASRLFLYWVSRFLQGDTEVDDGSELRTTMKAMAMFGVPPEDLWPYNTGQYAVEPGAAIFAAAQNYKAIEYLRLDCQGIQPVSVLVNVKNAIRKGFPSMFGFTCYSSLDSAEHTGKIPFPARNEKVIGGHAIIACGFDDTITIGKHKGAFVIRNSWGDGWGKDGYGWLPYEYVLTGLACDFWTMQKASWLDTGLFL